MRSSAVLSQYTIPETDILQTIHDLIEEPQDGVASLPQEKRFSDHLNWRKLILSSLLWIHKTYFIF